MSPESDTNRAEGDSGENRAGASPAQGGTLPLRIVGALLLVAAAFLYAHDLRAGRRRASGASAVRYVAGASVLGMGLRAAPDGAVSDRPLYEPCSPEIASNILSRLAEAEPVKVPAFGESSRTYDLFLFLTNRSRVFMRARREPGSDSAFVSLREPRRTSGFGAKDESFTFVESSPALVTGLGKVFDEIDSGSLASLRGARLVQGGGARALTNLVRRAGVAGLTEESLASTEASLRAIAGGARISGAALAKGGYAAGRGAMRPLSPEELGEAVSALRSAADAGDVSGTFEGDDYALLLVLDDGHAVNLRAAVRESDPDNALVGFLDAAAPDGEGGSPRLVVTEPALVPGLGRILSAAAAR